MGGVDVGRLEALRGTEKVGVSHRTGKSERAEKHRTFQLGGRIRERLNEGR